jgi:hypothetical protein
VAKANKVLNNPSGQSAAVVEALTMEIHRLKSLLQLLLRRCGSKVDLSTLAEEISSLGIPPGSKGEAPSPSKKRISDINPSSDDMEDFDACISQELVNLKDENFGLLRDVYNIQEELCSLRNEKQKILSAIYDNGMSLSSRVDGNDGYALSNMGSAGGDDSNSDKCVFHLQQQVLESQRDDLDMRKEVLDQAEDMQEERWQFLQQYHQWLHTQASPMNNLEAGRLNGIDEDIYRRVCLMEASVLLQADELQRTKKLFLAVSDVNYFICMLNLLCFDTRF